MARYHINVEGKILPCRASVKKCPYYNSFHADTKEELYPKVIERYSNERVSESVSRRLDTGEPISGLSLISNELETSKAPVEMMIATLGSAITKANSGEMPAHLKEAEKEAISLGVQIFKSGGQPQLPPSLLKKSREQWENLPASERHPKWFDESSRNLYGQQINDMRGSLNEIEHWKETHVTMTPEEKKIYLNNLNTDFNYYSKALNTSKIITQPNLDTAKTNDELVSNLKKFSNTELLSMYDDLSISDGEIEQSLKEVNFFQYKRRSDLSEKANDNIERWHENNRNKAKRYVLGNSKRILVRLFVAKELMSRDLQFGDFIRATTERSK